MDRKREEESRKSMREWERKLSIRNEVKPKCNRTNAIKVKRNVRIAWTLRMIEIEISKANAGKNIFCVMQIWCQDVVDSSVIHACRNTKRYVFVVSFLSICSRRMSFYLSLVLSWTNAFSFCASVVIRFVHLVVEVLSALYVFPNLFASHTHTPLQPIAMSENTDTTHTLSVKPKMWWRKKWSNERNGWERNDKKKNAAS